MDSASEGEVFLSEIGDGDGEEGDEHFGRCGIDSADIDQQFESEVVDGEIEHDDKDIASELVPSAERRAGESDVFIEPEACEQSDGEDQAEGSNVGRKGDEPDMDIAVSDDEIVRKKVEQPVEHHVCGAANAVAEELGRAYPPERRIEKIDERSD